MSNSQSSENSGPMISPISISRRDQEQIIIRAKHDGALKKALKSLGLELPAQRARSFSGKNSAMWFSPDELLLFVDDAAGSIAMIKPKLPKSHLVHDVSGARVVFSLKGEFIEDALAKGCPRDLRGLAAGEVVRTRLGQVAVAFWFLGPDKLELVCFRSVADYVEEWLKMACRTDGLPVLG